jgi:hypothetical protein
MAGRACDRGGETVHHPNPARKLGALHRTRISKSIGLPPVQRRRYARATVAGGFNDSAGVAAADLPCLRKQL